MKKRLLSILLAVVMLLGLVPMAQAEDTAITEVVISDVKAPVAGEQMSDATYKVAAVAETAPYTVDSVTWYGAGGNFTGDKTFIEGKQYKVQVVLQKKEGYNFTHADTTTITINGQVGTLNAIWSNGTAGFTLLMTATGDGTPVVLGTKTYYYDGFLPVVGEKRPASLPTYSESNRYNYTSQGTNIMEDGQPMTADTFTAGKTYSFDVVVTADENCAFSPDIPYAGWWLDMADYDGVLIDRTETTLTFRFTTVAQILINSVEITYTAPIAGSKLSMDLAAFPEDANYDVRFVWEYKNTAGKTVEFDGSTNAPYVVAGIPYTLEAYITPHEGYSFASDADFLVTFNGEKVKRFSHGGERRWGYRMQDIYPTIDEQYQYDIRVTGGQALVDDAPVETVYGGSLVNLVADTPADGMVFQKWVCESGNAEIWDAYAAQTKLNVYDEDVVIKAVFVEARDFTITAEGGIIEPADYQPGDEIVVRFPKVNDHGEIIWTVDANEGLSYYDSWEDEEDFVCVYFTMRNDDIVIVGNYIPAPQKFTLQMDSVPLADAPVQLPTLVDVDGKTDGLEEYEDWLWLYWARIDENGEVLSWEDETFHEGATYELYIYSDFKYYYNIDSEITLLIDNKECVLESKVDEWGDPYMSVRFVASAQPPVTYGDVDGDTKVTAADALEVLKSVVGKVTLTETQVTAADTDGNGKVDAADALNILKKVVGKIDQFPVEQ